MIDTHAHLNFQAFESDYGKVIDRAFKSGITAIINVGSNLETSLKAVQISQAYNKGIFAAVGLHPIHVKDESFDESQFLSLAKANKVVAIGETGLDYYHDKSNAGQQKSVLKKSLQLATKVDKPVILHSRLAGEEILDILKEFNFTGQGVMHCFSEDWQIAKKFLALGLYLSFTGIITFKNNHMVQDVIKKMPLNRLMIETDSPYLSPEPYRGERNEPKNVIEVAKKIAEIKNIPLEKIASITSQNAISFFNLTNFLQAC